MRLYRSRDKLPKRIWDLYRAIVREFKNWHRTDWRTKITAWTSGFAADSAAIYDVQTYGWNAYLSDHDHSGSAFINHGWDKLAWNKLAFALLLETVRAPQPKVVGVISYGRVKLMTDSTGVNPLDELSARLAEGHLLVFKPVDSSGGRGVVVVSRAQDGCSFLLNGTSARQIVDFVSTLNGYMITEYVTQAPYASAIFSGSVNTIRIVTLWDFDKNEPFIAAAVHRFGTSHSAPTDNWSRGGLSAEIDLETGVLGPAVAKPSGGGPLSRFDFHPDSGSRIRGVQVPGWKSIQGSILGFAAELSFFSCLGWDVVVTPGGFSILEGNSHFDVDLLQVHRPLLLNPRTSRFYKRVFDMMDAYRNITMNEARILVR